MASGEVVIQSMWSPAVTAVRSKGIACTFQPLKEGYRAWASGFGLPRTLIGQEARRSPTSSSTGSSTAGPAPTSTARATTRAVLETAKAKMEPYEWAYWMEGKPAEKDIKAPDGDAAREGRRDARRRLLRAAHGRASPAGTR